MRLVIEDDDLALPAAERTQDPRRDHVRCLPESVRRLRLSPTQQLASIPETPWISLESLGRKTW